MMDRQDASSGRSGVVGPRRDSGILSSTASEGGTMAFFVGLVVFVVIIGVLDTRLPWPDPRSGRR